MVRRSAISMVDNPCATSWVISPSRAVSRWALSISGAISAGRASSNQCQRLQHVAIPRAAFQVSPCRLHQGSDRLIATRPLHKPIDVVAEELVIEEAAT